MVGRRVWVGYLCKLVGWSIGRSVETSLRPEWTRRTGTRRDHKMRPGPLYYPLLQVLPIFYFFPCCFFCSPWPLLCHCLLLVATAAYFSSPHLPIPILIPILIPMCVFPFPPHSPENHAVSQMRSAALRCNLVAAWDAALTACVRRYLCT